MGLMDLADSFFVGRVATKNVTPAKHVAKGAQSGVEVSRKSNNERLPSSHEAKV
jgi:hypothetical protein